MFDVPCMLSCCGDFAQLPVVCLCYKQVGDASVEGSGEGAHGITATEWRVATALFTAGEVSATRG